MHIISTEKKKKASTPRSLGNRPSGNGSNKINWKATVRNHRSRKARTSWKLSYMRPPPQSRCGTPPLPPRGQASHLVAGLFFCHFLLTQGESLKNYSEWAEAGNLEDSVNQKGRAKGPTLCLLFLSSGQWRSQATGKFQLRFQSKTSLDLNPGSAAYYVIWNGLFSLGVFFTCKTGIPPT